MKLFFIFLCTGRYIEDFTYIETSIIPLDGEVVLSESNIDVCSVACVANEAFSCKSFDYCKETKTCLLNSGEKQNIKKIKASQADVKDSCAHYRSS